MRKDIKIPEATKVRIAVVRKSDELDKPEWSVHLLNLNDFAIDNVLVSSKGYGVKGGKTEKTSVLRHYFEHIESHSSTLIELIQPEVFHLNNEYWVSYYHDGQIHDRKFIFLPDTIKKENLQYIDLLKTHAVLHS